MNRNMIYYDSGHPIYWLFGHIFPARSTTRAYLVNQLRRRGVVVEQIDRECLKELTDYELRFARFVADTMRVGWLGEMMRTVENDALIIAEMILRGSSEFDREPIREILSKHGITVAPPEKTHGLDENEDIDVRLVEVKKKIQALRDAGRLTPEDEADLKRLEE